MPEFTKRQMEIINASIRIIAEHGIQDLTIKNLAHRIGITEPAIYRHFQNKMEILSAILAFFEQSSTELFESVLSLDISAVDKIETVYLNHFRQFAKRPALASVIFSEEIFQNDRRLADKVLQIMDTMHGYILKIITQSDKGMRTDIPPQHLATVIMGSLRFIVTRWRLSNNSFDLENEGKHFWKSLRLVLQDA